MEISFLSSDSILKKNNSDAAKQSLFLSVCLCVWVLMCGYNYTKASQKDAGHNRMWQIS